MKILAHRGLWDCPEEKNSRRAFERALSRGFGIETDIRDCAGQLVVSHDMPRLNADPQMQMSLTTFLDLYVGFKGHSTLALNIKSDGLVAPLYSELSKRSITSYFVFDMSVPDTLGYLSKGMPVFTRRSEFETGSILDLRAQGFWLDTFEAPHVPDQMILSCVQEGKPVAIVSPELHRKPHGGAWETWRTLMRSLTVEQRGTVILCTDFPIEAERYFSIS